MGDFHWIVHDAEGNDVAGSDSFDTQEEAEAFMAAEWSRLLEDGGESASLKRGDQLLYRMGLRPG